MNKYLQINTLLKFFSFFLVFMFLCNIQTVWWHQFFSHFPSPLLWLTLIVFFILKWPLYSGIFFSYFLGFVALQYTHAPLKMIWFTLNFVYILIWTFKSRINSTSLISFAFLAALTSFLYSAFYFLFSHVFEQVPIRFNGLHRLTETGLTFIFSIPCYFVFSWIDDQFKIKEKWNSEKNNTRQTGDELL